MKESEKDEECGGQSFSKLKYADSKEVHKKFNDDYGPGTVNDKIMLEIELSMDQF